MQIGRLCRKQTLRHARHDGTEDDNRQPAVPRQRHRRVHPQAPHQTDRVVQIDPRRSARSRHPAARGGHLPPRLRRTDRSSRSHDKRHLQRRKETDHTRLQQDRRLYLQAERRRRPDAPHKGKHHARRVAGDMDGQDAAKLHLHLRAGKEQHRRTQSPALQQSKRDTHQTLPVQRLPLQQIRRIGRRAAIRNKHKNASTALFKWLKGMIKKQRRSYIGCVTSSILNRIPASRTRIFIKAWYKPYISQLAKEYYFNL